MKEGELKITVLLLVAFLVLFSLHLSISSFSSYSSISNGRFSPVSITGHVTSGSCTGNVDDCINYQTFFDGNTELAEAIGCLPPGCYPDIEGINAGFYDSEWTCEDLSYYYGDDYSGESNAVDACLREGCEWNDCEGNFDSCSDFTTELVCDMWGEYHGCTWTGSKCNGTFESYNGNTCEPFTGDEACEEVSGCNFVGGQSGCSGDASGMCSDMGPGNWKWCGYLPVCGLPMEDYFGVGDCSLITSESDCLALEEVGCTWTAGTGTTTGVTDGTSGTQTSVYNLDLAECRKLDINKDCTINSLDGSILDLNLNGVDFSSSCPKCTLDDLDLNGDGKIDASDKILLNAYINGLLPECKNIEVCEGVPLTLTESECRRVNINRRGGDCSVDAQDKLLLIQKINGAFKSSMCPECIESDFDINLDGFVNDKDKAIMNNFLNGLYSGCGSLCFVEEDAVEFRGSSPSIGVCEPNWTCSWSKCIAGFSYQTCVDSNKCGIDYDVSPPRRCTVSKSSPSIVDAGGGVGGTSSSSKCVPDVVCGEWSECDAKYSFDDLLGDVGSVKGKQIRTCMDRNDCFVTEFDEQACSIDLEIYAEEEEWCGENYLFIYNRDSNQLIARILDRTLDDLPSFDVSLLVGSSVQYCNYCFNGIIDGDEESVDCGGSCVECGSEAVGDFSENSTDSYEPSLTERLFNNLF